MNDKLTAILSEREGLRSEILEYQKSTHAIFIYFFVLLGGLAGLLADKNLGLINLPNLRSLLLVVISQIEFLFSLFLISNMANINVHRSYLIALEKEINNLVKRKVSLWETEVSYRFLFRPYRAHFLSIFFMACFIILFCFLIIIFSDEFEFNQWFKLIVGMEILILIFLLVLLFIESKIVPKYTLKIFKR